VDDGPPFEASGEPWTDTSPGRRWTNSDPDVDQPTGLDTGQQTLDQAASPYEQGEISPWYGGDDGLGESGSSLAGGQPAQAGYDPGQIAKAPKAAE